MKLIKTKIPGPLIIKSKIHRDHRGFLRETFKNNLFKSIKFPFEILSYSKKNVLRGLHYQKKNPQGKLVSVVKGAILDVAVDIRKSSKTYGKYQAFILSEENNKQLWVPKNFAHGFLALSSSCIVNYKCTNYYDPDDQNTILWNDKDLNIGWPVKKPIISEQDKRGTLFKDIF